MHHAPQGSAGVPANLVNIMTAWLLWCDVGKLTTDDPISWEKTASSSISSFFLLHSILSPLFFILFFCLLPSLPAPFVFPSSHCSLLHLLLSFYFFFFPVFLHCLFLIFQPRPTPNYNLFQSSILFPLHSYFTSILQRIHVFSLLYLFLPFSFHFASVFNHLLPCDPFIQQYYLFFCKYQSLKKQPNNLEHNSY